MFDDNFGASVCQEVEKDMGVDTGDALESIRTGALVKIGKRADNVLCGRRSFLIVIVVVAIAIFGGAGVPSGLTMK